MVELRPSDQVTERLDVVMVHRGLAESRARAQGLIMAGAVRVGGAAAFRGLQEVSVGGGVEIIGPGGSFVRRGGGKLAGAVDAFNVAVRGTVAPRVGAAAGG